jgi:hypothetical protein
MELRRRESAPEPRRRFCPLGDTWADMSPAAPPYADVLGSVAEFVRQPIRAGARNFLIVQVECKY